MLHLVRGVDVPGSQTKVWEVRSKVATRCVRTAAVCNSLLVLCWVRSARYLFIFSGRIIVQYSERAVEVALASGWRDTICSMCLLLCLLICSGAPEGFS